MKEAFRVDSRVGDRQREREREKRGKEREEQSRAEHGGALRQREGTE